MGIPSTLLRPGLIPYQDAWELQQRVAAGVREGMPPTLILLAHPPTYTLGLRARAEHLLLDEDALRAHGAAVCRTDRGGDVTFHGPGQIVAYPILDLRLVGRGPRWYVQSLETILIDALGRFRIDAGRARGRPGVWVGGAKIAAIGVRVSRGVTTHGFALNVNADLSYFDHIIPCGLAGATVTSMRQIAGVAFDLRRVEGAIVTAFARQFDLSFSEADAPSACAPAAAMVSGAR